MDKLTEELESIANRHGKLAELDYLASYSLSFLAVAGSIVASICAALGVEPKALLAILAVIPAAVLSIRGTFKFDEKASWHFKKSHKLKALTRSIKYEGANPAAVSADFAKIEQELDEQWPRFGKPGTKNE
jgi:hypothetical protein